MICPVCGGDSFVQTSGGGLEKPFADPLDDFHPGILIEVQCEKCWTTFTGWDEDWIVAKQMAYRWLEND